MVHTSGSGLFYAPSQNGKNLSLTRGKGRKKVAPVCTDWACLSSDSSVQAGSVEEEMVEISFFLIFAMRIA